MNKEETEILKAFRATREEMSVEDYCEKFGLPIEDFKGSEIELEAKAIYTYMGCGLYIELLENGGHYLLLERSGYTVEEDGLPLLEEKLCRFAIDQYPEEVNAMMGHVFIDESIAKAIKLLNDAGIAYLLYTYEDVMDRALETEREKPSRGEAERIIAEIRDQGYIEDKMNDEISERLPD